MDLDSLMDFAARTATEAGRVVLPSFKSASFELKGDGSEVTAADHAAEELIRRVIAERFPGDGIVGEEGGESAGTTGRRWIVDPIDATRSYASGVPLFGVLLALEDGGEPVLGCCHLPALGETLVAARGAGVWLNGERAAASRTDEMGAARVVTSGLEYWRDWATPEARDGWTDLVGACRFARTWGDCYGYFLVATGRADVLADPAVGSYWDFAPMIPILAECGARFTTLTGGAVHTWSTGLACNPALHPQATRFWSHLSDAEMQAPEILRRHVR